MDGEKICTYKSEIMAELCDNNLKKKKSKLDLICIRRFDFSNRLSSRGDQNYAKFVIGKGLSRLPRGLVKHRQHCCVNICRYIG